MHTQIHTYIQKYIHTHIHIYTHTYIHTHTYINIHIDKKTRVVEGNNFSRNYVHNCGHNHLCPLMYT